MNPSRLFILRPVGTTLLMAAILLVGIIAYRFLPVSALPEVDYPTIQVQTFFPGASPEVMTAAVTAPLKRQFGQMPGLSQMSSVSSGGASAVTLQFALNLSLDVAEQEVQAAINAATSLLPSDLPAPPIYNKVNPADTPVLTLALTSKTMPLTQIEDLADVRLAQKISQQPGVGLVSISGGNRPAVRVVVNPRALSAYGLAIDDVRTVIGNQNTDTPKGSFDGATRSSTINDNDQLTSADQYRSLVIAYKNGRAVHLGDVATVIDGAENNQLAAWANRTPAVILNVQRQPGSNVIAVVNGIKALLPKLQAAMPASIDVAVLSDRTTTIRASVADVEFELGLAVALVVLVIFLFLRNLPATLIPSLSVPLSLVGTLAAMYLLGFSLDNLSLMALTISTGFVVDDAIVMIENIARHVEDGDSPLEAALRGSAEIGFTIVSLTVSLTTTPMLCALFLRPAAPKAGRRRSFGARAQAFSGRTLAWTLDRTPLILAILAATVVLNVVLLAAIPKGFFPVQDTGRMIGILQADQSISFQAMSDKLTQMMAIVQRDPAVEGVVGATRAGGGGGASQTNTANMYVALKPKGGRDSLDTVTNRLRGELSRVPGARLILVPAQDIRVGGRQSSAAYQYALQADSTAEAYEWAPKLLRALQGNPALRDVNSDQQEAGLETLVTIDRATASRLGLTMSEIDNTLYDAFGQRAVSTIYNALNQYHVVMEVAPEYWQDPDILHQIRVSIAGGSPSGTAVTNAPSGTVTALGTAAAASGSSNSQRNAAQNALAASGGSIASAGAAVSTGQETMVPLSAVASFSRGKTALSVNHQSQLVAATISFNLAPGKSLGDASAVINQAVQDLHMPADITGGFAGTAQVFQQSLGNEAVLVGAALLAVYIVLGVLYESFIHPITILSTLPSAGIGAVLALMLCGTEFSLIAVIGVIGVILLIGIVKKNAILMIDFALHAERTRGASSHDAIYQACLMRFRPITMTTAAALLGALPLAFAYGSGSELRQPLGISIVGGLIVSQVLTLYTTPAVYLALDRLRLRRGGQPAAAAAE